MSMLGVGGSVVMLRVGDSVVMLNVNDLVVMDLGGVGLEVIQCVACVICICRVGPCASQKGTSQIRQLKRLNPVAAELRSDDGEESGVVLHSENTAIANVPSAGVHGPSEGENRTGGYVLLQLRYHTAFGFEMGNQLIVVIIGLVLRPSTS